jgi:hypothetical protein
MANRDTLLRDTRGATLYVEFLLIVPLLALLWMVAETMHRLGDTQIGVQRQARQCAWVHAAGGCRGKVPEHCKLDGPARLDAPELARVAGSGLESAMRPVPGMSELFRRQSGDHVVARTAATVPLTGPLGGDTRRHGEQRMMCNDRPPALPEKAVADRACRGLLGEGGRCP